MDQLTFAKQLSKIKCMIDITGTTDSGTALTNLIKINVKNTHIALSVTIGFYQFRKYILIFPLNFHYFFTIFHYISSTKFIFQVYFFPYLTVSHANHPLYVPNR